MGTMMNEYHKQQARERGLGDIVNVLYTATILYAGWETDNEAWVVEMSDGSMAVLTISHGCICEWPQEEAEAKLLETLKSAESIRTTIKMAWPESLSIPTLSASRYLTQENKTKIMDFWTFLKSKHPDEVDGEVISLCDFLNANTAICTIASCSGHRRVHAGSRHGHLWLWMTEPIMKAFESRAFMLARNGCIQSLNKQYDADGRELVEINFFGQESEMLAESLSVIKEFFSSLIAES